MTNVKLKRISKNVTTSGKLRVVFVDEANPLTDEEGNPRLLNDGTAECEQISVEVTPAEYTDQAIYDALDDAADIALDRAVVSAEKRASVLAMNTLLCGVDAGDPEVVYEGDMSVVEEPVDEPTEVI